MVLIFQLNSGTICTVALHGTSNVIMSLNTICSCHLTPVVGKFFLSRPRSPFR